MTLDAAGCVLAVSIHALRTEGDARGTGRGGRDEVSIHALRTEGDCSKEIKWETAKCFNPRPPHGGRRFDTAANGNGVNVSIHALRTEGDRGMTTSSLPSTGFNPRPPHGGRRAASIIAAIGNSFQSTPSARRATAACHEEKVLFRVSIHALRTEGDVSEYPGSLPPKAFQSTPSARRATYTRYWAIHSSRVSIHALRTEGDSGYCSSSRAAPRFNPRPPHGGRPHGPRLAGRTARFNPRPPHGGRLYPRASVLLLGLFQSTPSARRATTPVS